MRVSLWLKLMGILGAIILAGALITFLVVNLATARQFHRFALTGDLIQAQNLAPLLADYYVQQGNWQGVESLLAQVETPAGITGGWHGMGPGMTHAPARSAGVGGRWGMMGGGWRDMDPELRQEMLDAMRGSRSLLDRVVLADAAGLVVADSAQALVGQRFSADQLSTAVPVIANERQIGSLLVGSMIEPVLSPLDQDFLRSVNLAVLLSAVAVGMLALVLGSFFFFHITAPIRDLTGAAEAIAAGDMSRRVRVRTEDEIGRLGQAFNTMADSLGRAEALRRQMVADISHELRTPLSLIQGSLEAILDGMYELSLDNVASVHEETLVLTRLVNDLRDLALAEAGQLRLEREEVDVADLVARSVERFRAQAAEQQVSLETELAPGLPPVHGDAQRLGQVLGNLLSNALRYTPPGGQIRIGVGVVSEEDWKTGRLEDWKTRRPNFLPTFQPSSLPTFQPSSLPAFQPSALPTFHPSNHPLLVTITDTGPGIPSEDVPYVFERFYRADKSRTRASGGSGLGLAIARQIVEAHGGHMGVQSQAGAGSTFFFTLPTQE